MDGIFRSVDASVLAATLAAAMTASWRIGIRRGRALKARGEDPSAGKIEDACLALLGLLLAFTFSMAIGKFDRRREMVVADSNAIGDFYTCASLLPDPVKGKLQALVRDYTERCLAVSRQGPSALTPDELKRFQEMHERMTELVAEAVRNGTPIANPLANTLNALVSNAVARLAAVRDRLPGSIILVVVFAAIVATALLGRHQATEPHLRIAGTVTFIMLVTLVFYVTLDLNQPGRGLIRVSQQPMEELLSSMNP